jgi:hypothetical protein
MRLFLALLTLVNMAVLANDDLLLEPGVYTDLLNRSFRRIVVYEKGDLKMYMIGPLKDHTIIALWSEDGWKKDDTKSKYIRYFNSSLITSTVINATSFEFTTEPQTPNGSNAGIEKSFFVKYASEQIAHELIRTLPLGYGIHVSSYAEALPLSPKPSPPPERAVVVDLGTSLFSLSSPKNAVLFDFDGDGFRAKSTWIQGTDLYFLALDRNSNRAIDHGGELFTPNTLDAFSKKRYSGFSALQTFDSDENGWIDDSDGIFHHLLLWNDANRDGKSTPEELKSLCELGVKAIGCHFFENRTIDDYGNGALFESEVILDSGAKARSQFIHFIRPN